MRGECLSAQQAGNAVALALVKSERYGDQLWVLAKMRKGHDCVVTGEHIDKRVSAYRPVTNGYNRMDRIQRLRHDPIDGEEQE